MSTSTGRRPSRTRRSFGTPAGVALVTSSLFLLAPNRAVAAEEHAPSFSMARDMMKWGTTAFVLSEVLEYGPSQTNRPVRYDLVGWVGGHTNRVWAKADGSQSTQSSDGDTEIQLLYGRLIAPFWDFQAGVRSDVRYGGGERRSRGLAAIGVQGLAPGWFELEPTLFVSFAGDISAALVASYDLYLTQRLILQPRLEVAAAVQSVSELGIGAGLNETDLGVRLRFEIWRELAPYLGFTWLRRWMESADFARAAGQDVTQLWLVAGLRVWY